MTDLTSYKRVIKLFAALVILLIEIFSYWFIWITYVNKAIEFPYWRRGNWLIIAIYAFFLILFLFSYGGLKLGYLKTGNLIYSNILSIVITNILAYLLLALIDKRFHNPSLYIILTAFDILSVSLWVLFFQYVYRHLFPARALLVVYGDKGVYSIINKVHSRKDKYIIGGAVNIDKGLEFVKTKIDRYEGVVIGDIESGFRNDILKYCYDKNIRTYSMPKLSDILLRSSTQLDLFDTPLLLSRNDELQIEQIVIKRIIDIILGSIFLVISLPLFIVFGIMIKSVDGGPIFYTQKRLTINGKTFEILKFRTMKVDAEKDGVARLAGENDTRITGVGKILRASRLDELPQLINIIKGDMSIVGPRPERPEIAREYEKELPEFRYRLKMKAGLTGYAQVYGKYNTTPYDKLKLDLNYIRYFSLWLDFKLIMMTPKILLMKESTEGLSEGKINALSNDRSLLKAEVYGKAENLEENIKK